MHHYMPEVLYRKIKQSRYKKEYEEIVNDIVLRFEKCNNLTQRLQYEDINHIKSDKKANEIYERLERFVEKRFPDMLIPYNIQLGKYNKKELLNLFEDMSFDTAENIEIATICLQEILDQSYEDGEYMKYLNLYKEAYEKIKIDIRQRLSTYVHENYIRSACLTLLDTLKEEESSNWLSTCGHYHEIYLKTMQIVYEADLDTLSHQFVECIADFLFAMNNSEHIEEYIGYFYTLVFTKMQFQYDAYSYGKARMLMIMSQIYLARENYTEFINSYFMLVRYLSNGFGNIHELIKGLTYFDTMNIGQYLAICRWVIRTSNECDLIKSDKSQVGILKNISLEDYDTATMNLKDLNIRSLPNDKKPITDISFFNDIDKWFSEKNIEYVHLKNLR